jgi:Na+-transporting methylmalonyl-CoA/oxaloacetate decarboxylase gamma subunit
MGNLLSIIFILIPIIFLFVSFISWIINKNEEYKSPNKKIKEVVLEAVADHQVAAVPLEAVVEEVAADVVDAEVAKSKDNE